MQEIKNKTTERRPFLRTLGVGAAAAALFSFLPFRPLKAKMKEEKAPAAGIKVTIHPSAVKRQKKDKA